MLFATGCDDGARDEKPSGSEVDAESDVEDSVTTDPGATDEVPSEEDTGTSVEDVLDTAEPEDAPATDTGGEVESDDAGEDDEADDVGEEDDAGEDDGVFTPDWPAGTDPFGDVVVSFDPGPDAGFGEEGFPDIVLGSPHGTRGGGGSLHVLSLGERGSIVIEFTDLGIIDGPGADLLVFENPFPTWSETGVVEVSNDGETWTGWVCDAENEEDGYPGCAGTTSVYATPEMLIDPTDPDVAGGDAFDLADIGVDSARFVRITDSGFNVAGYGGTTGGFDLDAVCAANWAPLTDE